jgi:hypothetical protein
MMKKKSGVTVFRGSAVSALGRGAFLDAARPVARSAGGDEFFVHRTRCDA